MRRFIAVMVILSAMVLSGCISLKIKNEPPSAHISAPESVVVIAKKGAKVTFDASGSNDTDGEIVNYTWEFGDGSTGIGKTVEHTYYDGGNYTVNLTVTDDEDATNATSTYIVVRDLRIWNCTLVTYTAPGGYRYVNVTIALQNNGTKLKQKDESVIRIRTYDKNGNPVQHADAEKTVNFSSSISENGGISAEQTIHGIAIALPDYSPTTVKIEVYWHNILMDRVFKVIP
jgi:hypothetical protein